MLQQDQLRGESYNNFQDILFEKHLFFRIFSLHFCCSCSALWEDQTLNLLLNQFANDKEDVSGELLHASDLLLLTRSLN